MADFMDKQKFRNSLRLKAIIAVFFVLLLSSSFITWLNYLNARQVIMSTMNTSAAQTVKINAYQLSRKLAENSKNTVNEIQNVTKQVIFSVENLVQGSQQVLNYIETNVMKDYELMVETGEQYFNDAEKFNILASDLSATSEELAASLESIMKGITEIAKANSESAEGTHNIVQNVTVVVRNVNEIIAMVDQTRDSSEKLIGMVDKFKV